MNQTTATPVTAKGKLDTESFVSFQSTQGLEMQGTPLKLSRYQVVFETYLASCVLRLSEVLSDFKIVVNNRTVYSGRAVISNLVNTGAVLVCEVKLDEGAWQDAAAFLPQMNGATLQAGFQEFLAQWHRVYRILPAYKATIADMQTFLSDLRLWLDQVELGLRSAPVGDRLQQERDLALALGDQTTRAIGELFEKFESIAEQVEHDTPEQRAAHSAFAKRLLHPLLLSSPFLYRTFRKPLGYAGDYEMVNMICRDPVEGSNLFAKIVNLWFLRQPPAEAHRNRIRYLVERLSEVSLRAAAGGRCARIVSVGCGPSIEVQRFLAETPLADRAEFTLIDFNEETAEHARTVLEAIKRAHRRNTQIKIVRKSVNQILKEAGRTVVRAATDQYDLVYCAGLFDYLSDPICRRLSTILYEWVAPGGMFVSTNVDSSNPRRLTMEYVMDWHLIYRHGTELAAVRP